MEVKLTRKLSHDETRQMEMFKKMRKQEKKLYAVKHIKCLHQCVPAILKEKMKGCDCEDCDIVCVFRASGIYCLTFRELCEKNLTHQCIMEMIQRRGK